MSRACIASCALLGLAACTTSQHVARPGAGMEHLISCGYLNWIYCYERAKELCPQGYQVLSESEGYRPRELRVACRASEK